jgi:hypothetical protein
MRISLSLIRSIAVLIVLGGYLVLPGSGFARNAATENPTWTLSGKTPAEASEPTETATPTEPAEDESETPTETVEPTETATETPEEEIPTEEPATETPDTSPTVETGAAEITVYRCPETVYVGGFSAADFAATCTTPEAGFAVTILQQAGSDIAAADDGAYVSTTDGAGVAHFGDIALGTYLIPVIDTALFFPDQGDEFSVSSAGTTSIRIYHATIVGAVSGQPESPAPSAPSAPASEPETTSPSISTTQLVSALPNTGSGDALSRASNGLLALGAALALVTLICAGTTLRRKQG